MSCTMQVSADMSRELYMDTRSNAMLTVQAIVNFCTPPPWQLMPITIQGQDMLVTLPKSSQTSIQTCFKTLQSQQQAAATTSTLMACQPWHSTTLRNSFIDFPEALLGQVGYLRGSIRYHAAPCSTPQTAVAFNCCMLQAAHCWPHSWPNGKGRWPNGLCQCKQDHIDQTLVPSAGFPPCWMPSLPTQPSGNTCVALCSTRLSPTPGWVQAMSPTERLQLQLLN
jgi:hypothetical protein